MFPIRLTVVIIERSRKWQLSNDWTTTLKISYRSVVLPLPIFFIIGHVVVELFMHLLISDLYSILARERNIKSQHQRSSHMGPSCVSFTLGHLYNGTLQEGKFSGLHPHLLVWMSVLMLVWWWWWCWLVDIVWCRSFKGVTMLWPPPPHDLSACCSDIYCPVIPDGSWRSDVV